VEERNIQGVNALDFPEGLALALELGGGKSDVPGDRGGRTAYGITQATYNTWKKELGHDVWNITPQEVEDIYHKRYWMGAGCDKLPGRLAVSHFIAAIHCGVSPANEFLEDSSWAESAEECRVFAYLSLYRAFLQRLSERPNQQQFLKGWMNRVNKTYRTVTR